MTARGPKKLPNSNLVSKVVYSFTPLLQESRGPPVVRNDTLSVHGNYFDF